MIKDFKSMALDSTVFDHYVAKIDSKALWRVVSTVDDVRSQWEKLDEERNALQ